MTYFIRRFADLLPEHFQMPRTPDSVRRSLDGELCIVAFDAGTAPAGWEDGMTQAELLTILTAEDSIGVWCTNEL